MTTSNSETAQSVIHYFLDHVRRETRDRALTVEQILKDAHLDPGTHYLVEIDGHHQKPHPDLSERLHLHEGQRFISVYRGATPVS